MNVRLSRIPFSVLALSSALIAAGCGGDDNDPTPAPEQPGQGHLIGAVHGELAPYLMERLGLAHSFGGSAEELGDVVLFSAPEGLTASHSSLPLLKDAYEQGKVVALTDASEGEINVLLNSLGLDASAPASEDGAPVPLFAIRQAAGGVGAEKTIAADCKRSAASEFITQEIVTSFEGPEDNPTSVQTREEIIGPAQVPEEDKDATQRMRADNFAHWVEAAKTRAQAPEAGVKAASDDLQTLAAADVLSVDCSKDRQSLVINYTMWSVHSFEQNKDYYFIQQSANLNPVKNWRWTGTHGGFNGYKTNSPDDPDCRNRNANCRRIQWGHMAWYKFSNHWREFVPTNPGVLGTSSPQNADNTEQVLSGFTLNLIGNVGFSGQTLTGSLSRTATWNSSRTVEVKDVAVRNSSDPDSSPDLAEWRYNFDIPHQGSNHYDYKELLDAPVLARNNFQPVNQWYWEVKDTFSDEAQAKGKLRFRTGFTAVNRRSTERVNVFWLPHYWAKDYDWIRYEGAWWVPLSKPPRLAVSPGDVILPQEGGSETVTLVAGRDWKATSSAEWLSVSDSDGKTSGGKTGNSGITLYLDAPSFGSRDFIWRHATVTLTSPDGKDKQIIQVSQPPENWQPIP